MSGNIFNPRQIRDALIVVDYQNDFIDGSLAINGAESILNNILQLSENMFTIATQDSHPINHKSFASNHKDKKPGDVIQLNNVDQVLWPNHCIMGTYGWELYDEFYNSGFIDVTFFKGTHYTIDSYSAFRENLVKTNPEDAGSQLSTGLSHYLLSMDIKRLYICGLATDYCVKYTVLDALKEDFSVYLIKDACKAVNIHEDDEIKAIEQMEQAGANIVCTRDVLEML